jgi:hypothetical protein
LEIMLSGDDGERSHRLSCGEVSWAPQAVRMDDSRVMLTAEQTGRSFAWLVSPELAERLARELGEKGWIVTIRPEFDPPESSED